MFYANLELHVSSRFETSMKFEATKSTKIDFNRKVMTLSICMQIW